MGEKKIKIDIFFFFCRNSIEKEEEEEAKIISGFEFDQSSQKVGSDSGAMMKHSVMTPLGFLWIILIVLFTRMSASSADYGESHSIHYLLIGWVGGGGGNIENVWQEPAGRASPVRHQLKRQ